MRGALFDARRRHDASIAPKRLSELLNESARQTAYIAPGSPWENGFTESFNARLQDELRDLLHAAGSSDHHRKLAASLQHRPPACLSRLQATRTGGLRAGIIRVAGCATPTGSAGHAGVTASSQLTFHLDHSMQAGHCNSRFWLVGWVVWNCCHEMDWARVRVAKSGPQLDQLLVSEAQKKLVNI